MNKLILSLDVTDSEADDNNPWLGITCVCVCVCYSGHWSELDRGQLLASLYSCLLRYSLCQVSG